MKKIKFIVVGTGRCGTVFMARFLTSISIPCSHESIFKDLGIDYARKIMNGEIQPSLSYTSTTKWVDGEEKKEIEWLTDLSQIEAESSYMAAPFLNDDILKDSKIIHIVRNPIRVINSFCNYINYFSQEYPTNCYEEFIYEIIPELKNKMSQYDRGCLYYILWNKLIEEQRKADLFVKIENAPKIIMNYLKINSDNPFSNDKINTFYKPVEEEFNLNLIQSKEIKDSIIEIGIKYGYKMSFSNLI
jgi:hypothetical protein